METVPSHPSRTSRRTPRPSLPSTSANGPGEIELRVRRPAGLGGVDPEARPLHRVYGPPEVRHPGDPHVLAGARARLDCGRRHPYGPVLRDDDPAGPGPVRGPQDGPEVARVGDAVEEEYQRLRGGEDLLQSGIRIRSDAGRYALVNSAPGKLLDPLPGCALHFYAARAGGLRDLLVSHRVDDLEDLSTPAPQSLDHGPYAVDGLLFQLPAAEDRTFRRILHGPPLGVEFVAQPVGGGPVLLDAVPSPSRPHAAEPPRQAPRST